jgi:Tol biopolymer transport system component
MVAPVDLDRRSVSGPAVTLEHGILESVGGFSGATQVAWSNAGTFAYVPNFTRGSEHALQWMTRDGKFTPTNLVLRSPFLGSGAMALSPDDKRVALRMLSDGSASGTDIWIGDFARSTLTRLTSSRTATDPVWTPDGTRVCYEDADAVLCQPFDGSAPPQSLFRRTVSAPSMASRTITPGGC